MDGMAMNAALPGKTPKRAARAMAGLRVAHRPWAQAGKPANLKRQTFWVYGREFDVLEDEVGVCEIRHHQDAN
jgi:hypothetical protein